MKYSQNPISGLVEVYSDDGVYLDTIYTTGDELRNENKPKRTVDAHFMRRLIDKVRPQRKVRDGEEWRTSEEGHHFKLETSTGEIKAGFGGKLNGQKVDPSKKSGGGNARKTTASKGTAAAAKSTANKPAPQKSPAERMEEITKQRKELQKNTSISPAKKQQQMLELSEQYRQAWIANEEANGRKPFKEPVAKSFGAEPALPPNYSEGTKASAPNSAQSLGKMTREERKQWLENAPAGTKITGLYNKSGPYAGEEVEIEKKSGYKKQPDITGRLGAVEFSEWTNGGYADPYMAKTLREAFEGTSKYYTTDPEEAKRLKEGATKQREVRKTQETARKTAALESAFGKTPEGYKNADYKTQKNYFRTQLANTKANLSKAQKAYEDTNRYYLSGSWKGKRTERSVLEDLRMYQSQANELNGKYRKQYNVFTSEFDD